MQENDKMPLTSHLEELRYRLIICLISIFIGFLISYIFKEKIFEILARPLISVMGKGEKLIFTGLLEAFYTYVKVSVICGIMISVPVILYQFWVFAAPGLYENEKKLLIPIILLSSLFFLGGVLFAYFIFFPYGFKFLLEFATEDIKPLLSMREYLSFATTFLFAFGLIFEIPLLITVLARLGIVSASFLQTNRKYSILIIFIIAAILTPPDAFSQIMMAIPLMGLYEISIIGAKIFGKNKS